MRSLALWLLLALLEDVKANQRIVFSLIDVGMPIRHNPPEKRRKGDRFIYWPECLLLAASNLSLTPPPRALPIPSPHATVLPSR